jgi:hypothetical protein
MRQRAQCPQCGKVMTVQVPRGGDGSVDVFPRHRLPNKAPCEMSRNEAPLRSYK